MFLGDLNYFCLTILRNLMLLAEKVLQLLILISHLQVYNFSKGSQVHVLTAVADGTQH